MSTRNSKATPAKLQGIREGHSSRRNPLAALFLKLIVSTGAAERDVWDKLMFKYLSDLRNAIPRNKKDQATAKGNLQKELLKDDLTFNVFTKGLRFLDFTDIKIIIQATRSSNGETIQVEQPLSLGERIHVPIDRSEDKEG